MTNTPKQDGQRIAFRQPIDLKCDKCGQEYPDYCSHFCFTEDYCAEREKMTESKLIAKLYANGYNDAATFLVDEQDPRSMTEIVAAQQGSKGECER